MIQFLITGKIGSDATVSSTKNGKALNFSVCSSETFVNKQGEKVENATWVQVVKYFDEKHEVKIAPYLKKGAAVCVTGFPRPDSWTDKNNGEIKNKLVVTADRIELQ